MTHAKPTVTPLTPPSRVATSQLLATPKALGPHQGSLWPLVLLATLEGHVCALWFAVPPGNYGSDKEPHDGVFTDAQSFCFGADRSDPHPQGGLGALGWSSPRLSTSPFSFPLVTLVFTSFKVRCSDRTHPQV